MIDERFIELLLQQVEQEKSEKLALLDEVKALREEVALLRAQNYELSTKREALVKELNDRIVRLTQLVEDKDQTIAGMAKAVEEMSKVNQGLSEQLKHHLGKRFGRTSEQARLLNNRNTDRRGEEKSSYDGEPRPSIPESTPDAEATPVKDEENGKGGSKDYGCELGGKDKRPRPAEESQPKEIDETITHRLDSYYTLPEGARFKVGSDGQRETHYFEVIEYLPARVVRHIYETAYVVMPGRSEGDPEYVSTLPAEVRAMRPVKGCPFTSGMLWFILSEKYLYHASMSTVRHKLKDMGARFSKSDLNRYYHKTAWALAACLEEEFKKEIESSDYLMVDETCEDVGVEQPDGSVKYMKKYVWAFYAKLKQLVYYLYDKGSRSRESAMKIIGKFQGLLSTDGYSAYKIFEDAEKHPGVTHIGCWTHARRNWVDALESARKECLHMIDLIGELFSNEWTFKVLAPDDPDKIKELRSEYSIPILNDIYSYCRTLIADKALMAIPLLQKAVKYTLNQWNSLRNIIADGRAEISNNLVEQRMKTIKLMMKNSQVVGSEAAASNHAFMTSIFESARLNSIKVRDYIIYLLDNYRTAPPDDRRRLLPCYYVNNG